MDEPKGTPSRALVRFLEALAATLACLVVVIAAPVSAQSRISADWPTRDEACKAGDGPTWVYYEYPGNNTTYPQVPCCDTRFDLKSCNAVIAISTCQPGYRRVEGSPGLCEADGTPLIFKSLGPPCPWCGNPIDPSTANKYQEEVDYRGVGPFPLVFARRYNSLDTQTTVPGGPIQSMFWRGGFWRGEYDRGVRLSIDPTTQVSTLYVKRHDGRLELFMFDGTRWKADLDVRSRIVQRFDGGGAPIGWRYTNGDGTDLEEDYDAYGRLIVLRDRAGREQRLYYSDASTPANVAPYPGLLVRVVDPFGRALSFTYRPLSDAFYYGELTTMTDPAGRVYTYDYANPGNGFARKVTFPDGTSKTYTHDARGGLLSMTDENNVQFASWTFESQLAYGSQHAGGAGRVSMQYSYTGPSVVTNPRVANVTAYRTLSSESPTVTATRRYEAVMVHGVYRNVSISGDPCPECGPAAAAYDINGNIASRTDWNGNLSCSKYDLARNLETHRAEGLTGTCPTDLSAWTPSTAAGAVERKITREWHPTWRLPTLIAEPKRLTTFVYNGDGGLVCGTLADGTTPVPGVLCRRTETATTDLTGAAGRSPTPTGAPRAWTFTYDANGQVLTVDGPRTDVSDLSTLTYWPASATCATTLPDASPTGCRGQVQRTTNALGHVATFDAYNAHGQPLQVTDPNGLVIRLTYDARQRLLSRSVGAETTTYAYWPTGLLQRVTQPDGSYIDYTYDDAHRLKTVRDSLGNRTEYTLDALGNRKLEEVFDPGGTLVARRERQFNNLGRLEVARGNRPEEQTRYTYKPNGEIDTVTDPRGTLLTYQYDPLNRLKRILEPTPAGGTTELGYDGQDRLASVRDPKSVLTTYDVSGLGDANTEASPDRGTFQRTFDAAGNLKSSRDARAIETRYTYDELNRLKTLTFDPPSPAENVTYVYDLPACANGIGRLCGVTDAAGTSLFAYDPQGRLAYERRTVLGVTYATAFRYDTAGRLKEMDLPGGKTVVLDLDPLGRTYGVSTTVNGAPLTLTADTNYRADGVVTGERFGNQFVRVAQFDLDSRPRSEALPDAPPPDPGGGGTSAQVPLPAWAQGLLVALVGLLGIGLARRYHATARTLLIGLLAGLLALPPTDAYALDAVIDYDAAGNVKTRTTELGTTTYDYDPLGRLTSESGPKGANTYTYDANGNRLTDAAGSYTYPATSNRMATRRGVSVVHDPAGNLIDDGQGTTFVYNAAGRLAEVRKNGQTVATYVYDFRGRRNVKTTAQGTTVYHYDPAGKLVAETKGDGSAIRTYVWRDDTPIAVIEAGSGQGASERVYYLHADQLGTPRRATDANKRVVWRWESDAFGTTAPEEDPDRDGQKATVNLRFPGQYFDAETGLHYNYFRDYDPGIGRYVQSDPIGLRGGVNPYAYANLNALSFSDPNGLIAGQLVTALAVGGLLIGGIYVYSQYAPALPSKPKTDDPYSQLGVSLKDRPPTSAEPPPDYQPTPWIWPWNCPPDCRDEANRLRNAKEQIIQMEASAMLPRAGMRVTRQQLNQQIRQHNERCGWLYSVEYLLNLD